MGVDLAEILSRAREWLEEPFEAQSRQEIENLLNAQDEASEKELIDRFYRNLDFGTGGMRGVRGAGDNRMNLYTLAKATQALADAIIEDGDPDRGVVIAYDTRIGSIEYSIEAARVLCANGIRVYRFDDYCPVPILSFAVRHLQCQAGVVITASHNPPDYNGYKVYWEDGAQVVEPQDARIIGHYNAREGYGSIKRIPSESLSSHSLYEEVGEPIFQAYRNKVLSMRLHPEIVQKHGKDLSIVYTPLHGAGLRHVTRLLSESGFSNLHLVEEQAQPDGSFPSVSTPNPENPTAMKMALEKARAIGADLVLGTDPDSDRLGVYVRTREGDYFRPDGNQIGAILLEYLCSESNNANRPLIGSAMINTIVSSDLHLAIARHYGLAAFQTLTGFKHIGALVRAWEESGAPHKLVLGTEESFGYLVGDHARDKDGVSAAMWLAEAACFYKTQSKTLDAVLGDLWARHGCYREAAHSITCKGADGERLIVEMMERFRKAPPAKLAGNRLAKIEDYHSSKAYNPSGKVLDSIDLPQSNVLKWHYEDGSTVAVRPSGTEPKIKFYFGVLAKRDGVSPATLLKEADAKLTLFRKEMSELAEAK